jgi:hypothetical protein
MSGGSYNYLYSWPEDVQSRRPDLEEMAKRLEGLAWAGPAAAETRRIIRLLDDAEAAAHSLRDAWRAIEWWDSCDWSEAKAREDVEPYRPPVPRPHNGPDPEVLYRLIDIGEGRFELRAIREGKDGR